MRITDEIAHVTNPDTGGRPICFHTVTFPGVDSEPSAPVVLKPEEHDEHRRLEPGKALRLDLVWHVRRALEAVAGTSDHRRTMPGGGLRLLVP